MSASFAHATQPLLADWETYLHLHTSILSNFKVLVTVANMHLKPFYISLLTTTSFSLSLVKFRDEIIFTIYRYRSEYESSLGYVCQLVNR